MIVVSSSLGAPQQEPPPCSVWQAARRAAGADGGNEPKEGADGASQDVAKPEKIIFAWEPSNSTTEYENMREVFGEAIAEGAGVPCEILTTTDFNVTIESLSSGKAHMASLGASEYVEIHKKNPAVEVAFVLSDKEGKLNQVSYHSQVLCREEDVDQYKRADGTFSIDDIKGKDYAFVSLSSTSGFVIPATIFVSKFGMKNTDDFAESGGFFSTVTMAGSQVLSVYTLVNGDADLCSCDDTSASAAYNVVSGENGEVGTVYEIKEGLDGELANHAGKRLVCVESYPVPAVPFCVNTDFVPEDMRKDIVDYMCSSAVSDNPELFKDPSDKETVTKWKKTSDKVSFVPADDSYYDDFRQLIGEV